jgi:Lhr-like helicase
LTEHQVDSIQNYFSDLDYFLLRLSRNSHEIENAYASDLLKFNEINNYLSFEIGNDVYLVQDGNKIKVADFIRTRTFGSSPSTDILFAFKKGIIKTNASVKFIFEDAGLDTGRIEFDFDINDIKKVSAIHLIEKSV